MGWNDDPVVDDEGPDPRWGAPQSPPEQAFPTFGQSMGTMAKSAVGAIPGIVAGVVRAPYDVITDPLGGSKRDEQMLKGLAQGAKDIFTPAYKAAFAPGGVTEITPGEMSQAAETGGAGVANLGAGLVAPRVPGAAKAVASKVPPGSVGKVLRFAASEVAGQALGLPTGSGAGLYSGAKLVGRAGMAVLTHPAVVDRIGTVIKDRILRGAQGGNTKAVAEALAKAAEKDPEIAATIAEEMGKAPEFKVPGATTSEAQFLEGFAARRAARSGPPPAGTPPRVTAKMPVKGNVKMATVHTKPKGPADAPFTHKQRNTLLEDLQRKAAEDAGLDLFEVFGIEPGG